MINAHSTARPIQTSHRPPLPLQRSRRPRRPRANLGVREPRRARDGRAAAVHRLASTRGGARRLDGVPASRRGLLNVPGPGDGRRERATGLEPATFSLEG